MRMDTHKVAQAATKVDGAPDSHEDIGSEELFTFDCSAKMGSKTRGATDPESGRMLRADELAGIGGGADGAEDSESAMVLRAGGIAGVDGQTDRAADPEPGQM